MRLTRDQVLAAAERAERRARGEDPFAEPAPLDTTVAKPKRQRKAKSVTIPFEDYKRLVIAAECDDGIEWCENCNAWFDADDPVFIRADEYRGCVARVTHLEKDRHLCKRYRALESAELWKR